MISMPYANFQQKLSIFSDKNITDLKNLYHFDKPKTQFKRQKVPKKCIVLIM